MGHLLIDADTKGFTGLQAVALQRIDASAISIDKDKATPALKKLLEALQEHGSDDGRPTEVLICINGKSECAFTFVVDDLSEIQEILQWTIGRE